MVKWANKYPGLLLAALLILSFCLADGYHVIQYPPSGIHQWRQADCFAYARNYYTKGEGLLRPSFYNLAIKEGRSISELPIFYYVAAKLFHIFGVHYWVLRGLTFLCFFVGLFYLYKCTRFWIKEPLAAIFPVVLLATTPYYYYYALNFLSNVPAISLSFAGLYYMLRYEQSERKKYIVAGTLFFIFSTLLKPPDGGLIWLAYLCVAAKKAIFDKRGKNLLISIIISSIVIALSLFCWVKYVNWYNAINDNQINLIGIYPIWDMTLAQVIVTFKWSMFTVWTASYQQRIILYFLAAMLVIYIIKWRSLHEFLKYFTLFLLLGSVAYSILWFKAFDILDYYQLINVIAPTFLIVTILEYYCDKVSPKLNAITRYSVTAALLLLMAISIYHNRNIQHERFTETKQSTYILRKVFEVEPYLRKIGISPNDTVISIPDISPNITLTAFGNPGYTSFFDWDSMTMCHFNGFGAKYLLVNDSSYLHNSQYTPYMKKPLGEKDGIYIFGLR